jgi:hypothetical protein
MVTMYSYLVSSSISALDCVDSGPSGMVLRADPLVSCYKGEWNNHLFAIVLSVVIHILGIPAVVMYLFWKHRESIRRFSRWPLESLTRPFRREYHWWELIFILKRLLFAMASQFLFSNVNDYVRIIATVIVFLSFSYADFYCRPFRSRQVSKSTCNFALLLILTCQGLVFESDTSGTVLNIFIIFIFLLVVLLVVSNTRFLWSRFVPCWRKRDNVLLSMMQLQQLEEDVRRELLLLSCEERLDAAGEFEFNLVDLSSNIKTLSPSDKVEYLTFLKFVKQSAQIGENRIRISDMPEGMGIVTMLKVKSVQRQRLAD